MANKASWEKAYKDGYKFACEAYARHGQLTPQQIDINAGVAYQPWLKRHEPMPIECGKKLLEETVKALDHYVKSVGEAPLWQPTSTRTTSQVLNDLKALLKESGDAG